jgi:Amt family ammonium transporter
VTTGAMRIYYIFGIFEYRFLTFYPHEQLDITPTLLSVPRTLNTADTLFVIISTGLVLLMTAALGLFYGGLVHSKGILNTMMMSIASFGVVGIAWALLGYSLAFAPGGKWIGGLDYVALRGVGFDIRTGTTIPHLLYFAYQGTFAVITAALISGAKVERM